ncbi:MAG TPA: flagellar basal body-associated FliL family protein [Acetobacteraceae bacterium]|nr:flagellar basal body-associated FliL family protein [Acetobacteraceae bacterium]
MAEQDTDKNGAEQDAQAKPGGGRRRALLIGGPALVLAAIAGGAWKAGLLPFLAGAPHPQKAEEHPPIYIDLPEMVANLDSDPRRPRYIKLRARLEVAEPADQRAVQSAMPRLQDLFQTYLRDLRPDDLRGSMGTYRLREELIARADVAAAPGKVRDVLFVEMIVQ